MPSKKSQLRFYADECFPLTSVTYLRSKGISIIHAIETKTIGKSDLYHLKKSKNLNRILITVDRDFIYYEQVELNHQPGVLIISVSSVVSANINKCLIFAYPK